MKKVIRLTESELINVIKKVITEQGLVDPIIDLAKPGFEGIKGVRTPSGRTPKVEDGTDPDFNCKYLPYEKVKHFFDEAKTWNYSVDEVFMKKIIDGLKKHLDNYWGGGSGDLEIDRLLSQVKTKPGMGYLVRNFKLNNKNLYDSLDSYHRQPWFTIVSILEKNFDLPYGPSGCGGQL